jgi:L-lactate dehydrogenase complex protein LldG
VGDARADVLARVRRALGDSPAAPPEVPRRYRGAGRAEAGDTVALFCSRVAEYGASVHRIAPAAVATLVVERARARGARRLAVPAELPWRPDGLNLVVDEPPLTHDALDAVDGVLTGCALAVAETGTIVLDGGATSGRRALSLVPDWHVCVVDESQVVASVPDAIAALTAAIVAGHPLTLVSGPSATSDIELRRVEGVHGPRILEVVVTEGAS